MERDYKHMTRTLDYVLAAWSRCPHLRLAQLVVTASAVADPTLTDPYYIEDDKLVERLSNLYPTL
jgi:hypothetical protein